MPRREANVLAYLRGNANVAAAGVSDSSGNVWACFDNDRTLLLLDNRTFTTPNAASRLAAMMQRLARPEAPPPLGTELPASNKARLLNTLEARWHSSIPALTTILSPSGYVTSSPGTSITDLATVNEDGILYWATHAGEGEDLQHNSVFGFWTSTMCDSALDRLAPLAGHWANKEICYACTEVQQSNGQLAPECHYAITPTFVRNYMSFAANSVVFIDACTSAKQEFRDAFFAKGAGLYCGWDRPTTGSSWIVNETFFDLLCGTDDVMPQYPRQRPFLFDWVRDWMVSNGQNVDPSGGAHLWMNRNPQSPVFGLLRPTIFRMYTHDFPSDPQDYLEIEGDFGLDPGPSNRAVTIGGVALTGATSFGDVTVSARGHLSNVAHLTRWVVPFTYIRNGQGSLAAAQNSAQTSQNGRIWAAGNINPAARTISTFFPVGQAQYLVETESGSSPDIGTFTPFGSVTLNFDASFVIKADSVSASVSGGNAKLKWGPAQPDGPFNNGGR